MSSLILCDGATPALRRPVNAGTCELVSELVREPPSLLREARPEHARGDLQSEITLAVLSLREVADESHERPNLATGEREVRALDVAAAQLGADLSHGLQVGSPVPPTDDEGCESLPVEQFRCRIRLQVRPDR